MIQYLKDVFKNNGNARGWMYFLIGFLTPIGEKLIEWGNDPTKFNWFFLGAMLIGATITGLNGIKAFLDDHLSKKDS